MKRKVILNNMLIMFFIIGVNAITIIFSKQIHSLDGDFNSYTWGAKLAGIAEALKYGELRLWNPNIWNGVSGIHNFTDTFYPIAIFVCKLFWNSENGMLSFNAYVFFILIHGIIVTTGFYYLLKELGFDDILCIVSVLIGSPFVIANLTYLQLCWLPLFALLVLKAYKKEKVININSILAGIVFGLFLLQELSQGAVLGVLVVLVFYITAIYIMLRMQDGIKALKVTRLFIFIGLIGSGIGAINILPILSQQSELLRVAKAGFISAKERVSLEDFYENPVSLEAFRELLGAKSGQSYFGIIAVVFCLMGIFAKEKYSINSCRYVFQQFGKVLYIFILLASISCYLPEIIVHIPFANMLRETYLYSYLHPIAVMILEAFGASALYNFAVLKNKESFYNLPLMCVIIAFVLLHHVLTNYKHDSIYVLLILIISMVLLFKLKPNMKVMYMILALIGISAFLYTNIIWCNKNYRYSFTEAKEQYEKVEDGYKRLHSYMNTLSDGERVYRVMTWGGEKGTISANSVITGGGIMRKDIGNQFIEKR